MASHTKGRHRFRESAELGWYLLRNWFKPGRKSMVPYRHTVADAAQTGVVPP